MDAKSLSKYTPLKIKPKLYIEKGDKWEDRDIQAVQGNSVFLSTKIRDEYGISTGVQSLYSVNTPIKRIFI